MAKENRRIIRLVPFLLFDDVLFFFLSSIRLSFPRFGADVVGSSLIV